MRKTRLLVLASCAASLVAAAPAGAATYAVSGKQSVVDEEKGIYKMRGSLVGRWTITSFEEVAATEPYYEGRGTEHFRGCLDRRRDHSCKGDPSGTLSFSFDYWALYDGEALVWGSCWHPVTSGTGAFAGARGVIVMVDTPAKGGVRTDYIGNLTFGGKSKGKSGRRASAAVTPGPRAGCVAG
jgi:hypothetical protein